MLRIINAIFFIFPFAFFAYLIYWLLTNPFQYAATYGWFLFVFYMCAVYVVGAFIYEAKDVASNK